MAYAQYPVQAPQPWPYWSWYVALLTQNPAGEDVGCEVVNSATVGVADGCEDGCELTLRCEFSCELGTTDGDELIDGADVGEGQ